MANPDLPPRRRRRRWFAAATVALVVLTGAGVAEMLLRWQAGVLRFERLVYLPEALKADLGPRFVAAYRRAAREHFAEHGVRSRMPDLVADERYGVRHGTPGSPGAPTSHRTFAVDAFGFRNPRVPEAADVLVVGDSFTVGAAVADHDTFTARVGAALNRVAYQTAAGGWGPRQYHLAVEEYAPILRPQWVVIATYFDNDPGDVWMFDGWRASAFATYADFLMYRGLPLRRNPHDTWFDRHSVLVNLLRHRFGSDEPRLPAIAVSPPPDAARYRTVPLVSRPEIPRGTAALPAMVLEEETPERSLRVAFGSPGMPHTIHLRWRSEDTRAPASSLLQQPWWPPYAEAMDACVRAARAQGARPLVVLIPSRERVLAPFIAAARLDTPWPYAADVVPDGAARALASLAAALDADFLDLGPPLRDALARGTYPYADGDIHFNAAGHRLTAEAIAQHIRAADSAAADRRDSGDGHG